MYFKLFLVYVLYIKIHKTVFNSFRHANLTIALPSYGTLLCVWLEFYKVQCTAVIKKHFNGN